MAAVLNIQKLLRMTHLNYGPCSYDYYEKIKNIHSSIGQRKFKIHAFFYKQRLFSGQPQCCLIFTWFKPQMYLGRSFIHISITSCVHVMPVLFMLYLCVLFFIFIFIVIMINRIISWIQTRLLLCLFYRMCPVIFG